MLGSTSRDPVLKTPQQGTCRQKHSMFYPGPSPENLDVDHRECLGLEGPPQSAELIQDTTNGPHIRLGVVLLSLRDIIMATGWLLPGRLQSTVSLIRACS